MMKRGRPKEESARESSCTLCCGFRLDHTYNSQSFYPSYCFEAKLFIAKDQTM